MTAEQEWADKSLVWVRGESQYVELNEPILVRAARAALKDKWDPVSWVVSRMSNLSAAQQGYDFEQICARKVAAALLGNKLHIIDDTGKSLSVERAPDPQIATT
eukprot:scaffold135939_cov112-Attheya_sp.AAC.1